MVVKRGVVRCENGLTISHGVPKNIPLYTHVWVCYDFTHGRVVNILPEETENECPEEHISADYASCAEDEECISVFWDSGAL